MFRKANRWIEKRLGWLDVSRHGYVVNKMITRSAFGLCLLLMLVAVAVDGVDVLSGSVYMECDHEDGCLNPYYDSACVVDCPSRQVPEGWSTGEKPSFLSRNFGLIVIVVCGVAVAINHVMYNLKR